MEERDGAMALGETVTETELTAPDGVTALEGEGTLENVEDDVGE